jgi:hypothetical protein
MPARDDRSLPVRRRTGPPPGSWTAAPPPLNAAAPIGCSASQVTSGTWRAPLLTASTFAGQKDSHVAVRRHVPRRQRARVGGCH